ncbi:2763_t:CDS:2 [Acaulospora colombiana]|uniref:2763_t:CDS:1 n=1 Tax=Acaulospora colombiana TaxID=27376 RepID=A0ACA9KX15_9GLOM|nr:2763_t:CDS:2 [Acaulospora colombiana]
MNRGIPELLKNVIERCCDEDPDSRPSSAELLNIFGQWRTEEWGYFIDRSSELYRQIQEIDQNSTEYDPKKVVFNPRAVYTSRLLKVSAPGSAYAHDSKQIELICPDSQNFNESEEHF